MGEMLKNFIDGILKGLDIDEGKKRDIMDELTENFTEEKEELIRSGFEEKEAEKIIIENFGNPEKFSKKLLWIHGFGRFRKDILILRDSILGAIPLFMGTLIILLYSSAGLLGIPIKILHILNTVFFALCLLVSVNSFRKAFPAWTFPWSGIIFLYLIQILFVSLTLLAKLNFLPLVLIAFLICLAIYAIFKFSDFKRGLGLTLLFLLPFSLPFAFFGSDEIVMEYKILFEITIGLFATISAFFLLYSKLRLSYLITVIGFLFYTFSYLFITFAPHTFTGEDNFIYLLLGYLIPLILIGSIPIYYFLKERAYHRTKWFKITSSI